MGCFLQKNAYVCTDIRQTNGRKMNAEERKIIHIDMDAFYASVEQRDHPELRGRAIAIGSDSARGVVATASYEARPYGVHSAMSMQVAKKRCPSLIVVPGNYARYKEVSAQMHEIFHEYTDLVEPISLDEAFLDVTDNKVGIPLAVDIAREIKQKIRERLQLTASAGISYNKFLAKIASDVRKPDGICTVHPSVALDFIARLPVERFWGVGPKTVQTMHQMGVYSGLQLRQYSLHGLLQKFGKMGRVYYDFARGIDLRPVVAERERKSLSCEQTYEEDLTTRSAVVIQLYHCVEELLQRLQRHPFCGQTLTLKVKFSDFSQITRSITPPPTKAAHSHRGLISKAQILPLAKQLLAEVDGDGNGKPIPNYFAEHPVRLLGIGVSHPLHDTADYAASISNPQWIELELDFKEW